MRIGGLASGIDTEELINKLMTAERIPLDKMKQQNQKLTWQRDSLRDINKSLDEFFNKSFKMTQSDQFKPTKITSSIEGAVTATGGTSGSSYKIGVSKLASNAVNASTSGIGYANKTPIDPVPSDWVGDVNFTTYDKNGNAKDHSFKITAEDTLESVLKNLTVYSEGALNVVYDAGNDKVILETKQMGDYNPAGPEIDFSKDTRGFFAGFLKMSDTEQGGTDAVFTYNGVELKSKTNSYKINDLELQFNDVTGDKTANLVVQHDTDKAFDNIMNFIDQYNSVIDKLNKTQQEEKFRSFQPLTDEQKKDMSEEQIKKWEEKAKSGLLRGDSIITNALNQMRTAMYTKVESSGQYNVLTQIGLSTSSNYMDGGKIVLTNDQESKLKEALAKDPDSVMKLFTGEGENPGIVKRVRDSLKNTTKQIDERAGKTLSTTLEADTLGKNLKDLNKRISDFEKKLVQIETRYWNQFNAMEKAISKLNSQSTQLLSQFGGQ